MAPVSLLDQSLSTTQDGSRPGAQRQVPPRRGTDYGNVGLNTVRHPRRQPLDRLGKIQMSQSPASGAARSSAKLTER